MTTPTYRPDIDGLRTLAIMPVILFHAGASWLPGGFVGVDIFFVISGYLISSLILREIQAGEFSFLRFYERRLRRIIPALLGVLFVTVAAFQFIALPDQAQSAAESGIAALLSLSNFWFWRESGYFAPAAELFPLLHTWSLAVEEQFYLIFPIVLIVFWKLRLRIGMVLVLGALATFAIGLWLSFNKPSVAYYLLPARAWELLVGAVIASGVFPPVKTPALRETLSATGLGMILLSIFTIRSDMIFPGWVALLPCLGAAVVIHTGGQSWVANRILAARPMVFVGLLSYSLYLWHWPILALLRVRSGSIHLDPTPAIGAVILTFLFAWLSWRYVESPFRNRKTMTSKRMAAYLGGASVAVLGLAGLSIMMSGFPQRLAAPARAALAGASDIDPLRIPCEGIHDTNECRFGAPDQPITYAIIGDSHAAALRPAVEASNLMKDQAGTLYWTGACPMLDGAELYRHPERAKCTAFKTELWQEIEANPNLRTVILAGRWPFQMTGWLPESGGSNRTWLVDAQTVTPSAEENKAVLKRALQRTIDRLAAAGLDILIIGSVPEPGFDVPHTVAMARHVGLEAPRGIRQDAVKARAGAADDVIAEIAKNRANVRFISIWGAFCGNDWCDIERSGAPLYYDDDHLSYTGALHVAAPAIGAMKPKSLPR